MTKVRRRIRRPCIVCGQSTDRGSRCPKHALDAEVARQARQPYRAAYFSPFYRQERRFALKRAGDRCERVVDGLRCPLPAAETNHRRPLSTARTLEEAIALCDRSNLEAVCWRHNPRLGTAKP